MRHNLSLVLFLLVAVTSSFWIGCAGEENETTQSYVAFGAAFVNLGYVDVYNETGEFLQRIDHSVDFQEVLENGYYLMDFVDESSLHSFMDDGRLAFAPMTEGATPIDRVYVEDLGLYLWEVAVDPVLEGNARLNARLKNGDPNLEKWRPVLERSSETQFSSKGTQSYSTSYGSTSARARVTWEASFAMTGYYTTSSSSTITCNNSTTCWTRRGNGYAYWDYDSNGLGYIDSDTSAWSTLKKVYDPYVSCVDWGATSGCYNTVNTANAKNYTCQNNSGACTSGSGSAATKPRGGQCKAFANLLLYRSGQYGSGTWKTLPSQKTIYCSTNKYPVLTTSTITIGDILQRVDGVTGSCSDMNNLKISTVHTQIVVAYDSTAQTAIIVDSNYTGGDGYEYIGYHTAGFSSSNYSSYTLLSNYRDLDCVYGVTDKYDNDGDGNTTETWVCSQ